MIDFVRKKVSGSKIRYNEKGYNLDLTYITPRIIAMSIPGEGVHKVYRNSIDSVSKFLKETHDDKFRILNLSGIKYDYEKFNMNVSEYSWDDHYPPPIELLFRACQEMHFWLCKDIENIIVVNCRAGKGRTGTLICCYLIYSGRLTSPEQAMRYYKNKRFHKGGGVTQPSQVRYVCYFTSIFFSQVKSPLIVQLNKVDLITGPHMSGHTCKPIFEIKINDTLIYSSKKANRERQLTIHDDWTQQVLHEIDTPQGELFLQGDIQCFLKHWGLLKINKICRFTFNTAFVDDIMELRFNKKELDPDSFRHSRKVMENFEIILRFNRFCDCKAMMDFRERCDKCKLRVNHVEHEKWIVIRESIDERILYNPKILLFQIPENDDIDDVLSQSCEDSDMLSEGSAD